MGKQGKRKGLTKKDVEGICAKVMFKKYTKTLMKNHTRLQKASMRFTKDSLWQVQTNASLANLDVQLSELADSMSKLAFRVLVQDYILGRLTKAQVIETLNRAYQNEPLSVTEKLEEIEMERDKYLASQKPTAAFECYHANENPATCPCPKKCYCKDKTCLGKVSW